MNWETEKLIKEILINEDLYWEVKEASQAASNFKYRVLKYLENTVYDVDFMSENIDWSLIKEDFKSDLM